MLFFFSRAQKPGNGSGEFRRLRFWRVTTSERQWSVLSTNLSPQSWYVTRYAFFSYNQVYLVSELPTPFLRPVTYLLNPGKHSQICSLISHFSSKFRQIQDWFLSRFLQPLGFSWHHCSSPEEERYLVHRWGLWSDAVVHRVETLPNCFSF